MSALGEKQPRGRPGTNDRFQGQGGHSFGVAAAIPTGPDARIPQNCWRILLGSHSSDIANESNRLQNARSRWVASEHQMLSRLHILNNPLEIRRLGVPSILILCPIDLIAPGLGAGWLINAP
jgi:hypothetical protein